MAVPSHIGSNTQDTAAGLSLTFTVPAATTTDDLMICFVKQSENTTQRTWDDDGGGGNGWTREVYNRTTGGRDMETAIFWKFATSGSETNPTFTWASGITAEPMSGILEVYRGVDKVQPFGGGGITYADAQNDANPPNPSTTIDYINTRVLVFHGATHDDISTVAAPTGYTLRSQVWAGTNNDHRNVFSADLEVDTLGSYTPPDWQHSVLNTTPEYHTYTAALNELQPIHVTGGTALDPFFWGNTGLTITGDTFESVQGTGKVEFWSDISGTTKTVQTIDTWGDTSITIDTVQGSLVDPGTVYLVVTNDSGDVSAPIPVSVGLLDYPDAIVALGVDHYWRLNNSYNDTGDTGPTRNMTNGVVGTWTFSTQEIADGNTHSLNYSSVTNRREIADSANMNVTISSQERTIACWVQLNEIQSQLACLWKEGGGVQNLAFLIGYGNVFLAQLADVASTRDNVQAWSDFRLAVGRPYHVCMRYTHTEATKEMRLYVDGVEQTNTDGNPMTIGIFDSHSGDVTWGDPDSSLETGGTDILYNGLSDAQMSDFCTWSDNSGGTNAGALDKTTEIRDILFRRGALPDDIIATATESAQQTALDATADVRPDWPLSYRIMPLTTPGDAELVMTDKVFDSLITMHLEYRGSHTLTVVNAVGSNADAAKMFASSSGTIVVVDEVEVSVTTKLAADLSTVTDVSRVLVTAASGGDLPFEDTVTITRSGTTATVTHTAHGLRTGLKVKVLGADQQAYNGVFTITVTGANAYTYTVSGSPTTPATGTIEATSVIASGTTTSGVLTVSDHRYTSDQPIDVLVRRGSSSSPYKSAQASATITSSGASVDVFLISDG